LVGPHAAPLHGRAAGEGFVGVVDDRRDPHRAEAHVLDVLGVVEHAAEVAAEVADVVGLALRRAGHGAIEGVQRRALALVAVVVGGSPLTKRSVSTK
jgi:hypothetical protein